MGIFSRRCDRINPATNTRCTGRISRLSPGKFCPTCRADLSRPSSVGPATNTALSGRTRWERPAGIFARRFDFTIDGSNREQELDIELGTEVLLLEGGAARPSPSPGTARFSNRGGGAVSVLGMLRSLLQTERVPEQRYTVILVQSGAASCEVGVRDIVSSDGVDVGVQLEFWYQIASVEAFFKNVMRGEIELREETIDELVSGAVQAEVRSFLQRTPCAAIRTDPALQDSLLRAVQPILENACRRFGLSIERDPSGSRAIQLLAIHSEQLDRLARQRGALTERAAGIELVGRSLALDRTEGEQALERKRFETDQSLEAGRIDQRATLEGAKRDAETQAGLADVNRGARKVAAEDAVDSMRTEAQVHREKSGLEFGLEQDEAKRDAVRRKDASERSREEQAHESDMEHRRVDHQISIENKVAENQDRQREKDSARGRSEAMKDAESRRDLDGVNLQRETGRHGAELGMRRSELDLEADERARKDREHRENTEHAVRLQQEQAKFAAAMKREEEERQATLRREERDADRQYELRKQELDRSYEMDKLRLLQGLPPELAAQVGASMSPGALQVALAQVQQKTAAAQAAAGNDAEMAKLRAQVDQVQQLMELQRRHEDQLRMAKDDEARRMADLHKTSLEAMRDVAVAKSSPQPVNINNRGGHDDRRSRDSK